MVIARKMNPVARAIATIAAVATLVTGATFAALSSSVTLTGNTISAADANLQIWNGTTFTNTTEGFAVDDLVPGEWSEENFIYFKNVSGTPLNLTASSSEPQLAEGEDSFGFSGWENLKVRITSHNPDCADDNEGLTTMTNNDSDDNEEPGHSDSNVVETDMAALIAGDVELPCNSLGESAQGNAGNEGTEGNYSLAYKISSSAVGDSDDINIGAYDLTFTGTVAGTEDEPGTGTPPGDDDNGDDNGDDNSGDDTGNDTGDEPQNL